MCSTRGNQSFCGHIAYLAYLPWQSQPAPRPVPGFSRRCGSYARADLPWADPGLPREGCCACAAVWLRIRGRLQLPAVGCAPRCNCAGGRWGCGHPDAAALWIRISRCGRAMRGRGFGIQSNAQPHGPGPKKIECADTAAHFQGAPLGIAGRGWGPVCTAGARGLVAWRLLCLSNST